MINKKRYAAISKTILLESNEYLLQFDGFVFGDLQAKIVFCDLNNNYNHIKEKCFLLNDISCDYDIYIGIKDVFMQHFLPRVMVSSYVDSIYLCDYNNFEIIKHVVQANDSLIVAEEQYTRNTLEKNDFEYIFVYSQGGVGSVKKLEFKDQSLANKVFVLIPPDGVFNTFDFTLHKLSGELQKKGCKTILFCKTNSINDNEKMLFNEVKEFSTLAELICELSICECEKIIYRGWMMAYCLGAFLTQRFKNVVVYLKDIVRTEKEVYKTIFGIAEEEYNALDIIFKRALKVLSQFSDEQGAIWAKEYLVDDEKFIFLPEITEQSKWLYPKKDYIDISIAHAGSLPPTSVPRELFQTKSFFDDTKKITSKNDFLKVACVVAENVYDGIVGGSSWMYKDWLYENVSNKNFSIVRGRNMDPTILNDFHWGIFEFSDYTKYEELIKYTVPSKFAFYLEAGIPILVNEKLFLLAEIAKEHEIGIVFSNEDIDKLDEILDITQNRYDMLVSNVVKYRQHYYDGNLAAIDKLLEL